MNLLICALITLFAAVNANEVKDNMLLLSKIDQYNSNEEKKALLRDIEEIVDTEIKKNIPQKHAPKEKKPATPNHPSTTPKRHKVNSEKIYLNTKDISVSNLIELINKATESGIIFFEQKDPIIKRINFNQTVETALNAIGQKLDPKMYLIEEDGMLQFTSQAQKVEKSKDYLLKTYSIDNAIITQEFKKNLEQIWTQITKKDQDSIINIDAESRTVTLKGIKQDISEFKKFLKSVDKTRDRVKIDMIILLADKSSLFEFGLNWSGIYNRQKTIQSQGKNFGFTGLGGTLFDFPTPTEPIDPRFGDLYVNPNHFAINLFNSMLDSAVHMVDHALPFLKLPLVFGGPDLNTRRLNILVNAAQEEQKARILAKPTILTTNNQVAKVLVGTSIPLYTTVQDVVQSTVRTLNQITYKEVGISIQALPTISKDRKHITLDIYIELSDQKSGGTKTNEQGVNQNPPVFLTIKIKNNLVLENGQTAVISGIITKRDNSTTLKIPFIEKLPLIGRLFRSNANASTESEDFIFITPTILE